LTSYFSLGEWINEAEGYKRLDENEQQNIGSYIYFKVADIFGKNKWLVCSIIFDNILQTVTENKAKPSIKYC